MFIEFLNRFINQVWIYFFLHVTCLLVFECSLVMYEIKDAIIYFSRLARSIAST